MIFSVESGIEAYQPCFIQNVKCLEKIHWKVRSIRKTTTKREALKVIKMHIKFSGKGSLDLWLTWDGCHQ